MNYTFLKRMFNSVGTYYYENCYLFINLILCLSSLIYVIPIIRDDNAFKSDKNITYNYCYWIYVHARSSFHKSKKTFDYCYEKQTILYNLKCLLQLFINRPIIIWKLLNIKCANLNGVFFCLQNTMYIWYVILRIKICLRCC